MEGRGRFGFTIQASVCPSLFAPATRSGGVGLTRSTSAKTVS
jgi:hypothetical protein